MPTEPTVMEMVLDELRGIRKSIHELRDTMNSKLGDHANRLTGLEEWRDGHERWTAERMVKLEGYGTKLEDHGTALSEMNGALRALRWVGAAVIALLGIIEAWFHAGRHP